MMEAQHKKVAPVLSEADKKKSITGSKGQKRRVVLNTLDSPFDIQWPRITPEKENEVRHLLIQFLSPARSKSVSIPKETLKSLPKKERKQWRKNQPKESDDRTLLQRPHCCIGFRDVVKEVEEGTAALVVCDRNPTPTLLTKLLVPLCKTKSVPLVAIKDFTSTVSKVLNVPRCLTLALKLSAANIDNPLYVLHTKLKGISTEAGQSKEQSVVPEKIIKAPINIESAPCESDKPVDSQRFYLKRKAGGALSFVPGNVNPLTGSCTASGPLVTASQDSLGYISLGSAEVPKSGPSLMPMRIKRLPCNEEKSVKKKQKTARTPSKDQMKS